jgi:cyclic dehypoxanthinyl futalosine synthase
MNTAELLQRALAFDFLSIDEGVYLYNNASTADLMYVANELRKIQVPHGKVTWQIDRNVNTTNVCIANCKFCNFFRRPGTMMLTLLILRPTKRKLKKPSAMAATSFYYKAATTPIWAFSFIPTCSASLNSCILS